MTLSTGTKLSHYEITSQIGKGGMGEVYQATDTKLGRNVAIKVLPEEFARDADRVARFQREAKLLASLNHPNIAAIHGLEEVDGTHFLVMELVEGQTLDEQIKSGTIPVEEALKLALQIAEALEAAHEKGVIHRDLKPANIKVTPDGKVKALDFGLAKAYAGEQDQMNLSNSPTLSDMATQQGVILGTAAYMSPEQARGKSVDKRADIWAFGVVLFEMLTGKPLFSGDDVSQTLARVLERKPDFSTLPQNLHSRINLLLERCLEKDPRDRYGSISDARVDIQKVLSNPDNIFVPSEQVILPRRKLGSILPWLVTILILGAIIAGLAVWTLKPSKSSGVSTVMRFTVLDSGIPQGVEIPSILTLSPDGMKLVYTSRNQLYMKSMNSFESKPIQGTEGAISPFFSPNGEWIGFFGQGKLWKIPVGGGTRQELCHSITGLGGTWASDDSIYFAPFSTSGIWKVSASGSNPQPVTTRDPAKGEISHRWPQILPGGKAVLFTVWEGLGWDEQHMEVLFLETGERTPVQPGGRTGRYVDSGHLVYLRGFELMAVPFDLARFEATDSPVSLGFEVFNTGEGAQFAVSDKGTLAYIPGRGQREKRLAWVDRNGETEYLPGDPGPYEYITISPDGLTAAVEIPGPTIDIWRYDLNRGDKDPLTTGESCQFPVWLQKGKEIVYRKTREGFRNLYLLRLDGSGHEERLTESENLQHPYSESPDGRWLAYGEINPETNQDIWMLPLNGEGTPEVFLNTTNSEMIAMFSPKGGWLAYTSDVNGQNEIWIQSFPEPGKGIKVSTDGGFQPRWSPNGRELFYLKGNKMMAVDVAYKPTLTTGIPRSLFTGSFDQGSGYSISPDGQRFLMILASESGQASPQIRIVLNWFEELKELVPVP